MLVKGVPKEELDKIARAVGVRFRYDPKPEGRFFRFTLKPAALPSEGPPFVRYSERGAMGKPGRIDAVCFHGYGHFLAEVFAFNPHAVVHTKSVDYYGVEDFRLKALQVGETNVRSLMESKAYRETCRCSAEERRFL